MNRKIYICFSVVLITACAFGLVACSKESKIDTQISKLEKLAKKYEKAFKSGDDDYELLYIAEDIAIVADYLEENKKDMSKEQMAKVVTIMQELANLK